MPKNPPKINAWCDRALVVSPIYYALCLTKKAFKAELKHLKIKPQDRPLFIANAQSHATTHFFTSNGKTCAVVCVSETKKYSPSAVVGLLVHEAVHIWRAICDDIGEHRPSAEFHAYAMQCIVQELITKFSQLGGKFNARTQR